MIIFIMLLIGCLLNILISGFSTLSIAYAIFAALLLVLNISQLKEKVNKIYYKNKFINAVSASVLILSIALLVFSYFTNPYKEDMEYFNKLEAAQRYAEDGKTEKATALCEELLEEDTQDVNALLILGIMYMDNENYEKSHQYLINAYNIAPHDPDVLYNLGLNSYKNGKADNSYSQFDKAIEYYEMLLKIDPRLLKPHIYIGQIAMELENLQLAGHHFHLAYRLAPEDPSALWALADYQIRTYSYAEAAKTVDQALLLKLDKDSIKVFEEMKSQISLKLGGE